MNIAFPNPLQLSALQNLAKNQQWIQKFHDRVLSDIISKSIEGSITKTSLNKLIIHRREYKWSEDGGLIRNSVPTMIDLLLKSIKSATSIGDSNLKYHIEKATSDHFGNNIKYLIDDMSSNITIIIEKWYIDGGVTTPSRFVFIITSV